MNVIVKSLFALFLVFALHSDVLNGQGIQFFEGTWKEALEKAKAEDKLVFVDSYTTWCGPCIKMAKNVFTQESVGNFFNENFINLKLDMEKEDGISFGHKYPVKAYPTLQFIDGEGKVVKKIQGGQQAEGLISLGEAALKLNDKSGKYAEKYDEGNREYDLVLQYVKALNMAGKPSLKISNDYLNSQPDITEEQKNIFIYEAVVDADSKLFDRLTELKDKVTPVVGQIMYDKKIKKACENTVRKSIEFEMISLLDEAVVKMKKAFPDEGNIFELESKYKYFRAFRDEKSFIKTYRALIKEDAKNADQYQKIAKDIVQSFPENAEMMKDAVQYAEKFDDLKNNHESLNFFCNILMFHNDYTSAIKHVEKRKEEALKKGEETGFHDNLIRYLEGKKS